MIPGAVYVAHVAGYDSGLIKAFVRQGLEPLMAAGAGKKVLIKPNLVVGKRPEKAVNTHPALVRAVVEVLLEAGAAVSIGDSPGYESTEKALKASLIRPVVDEYGLHVAHFSGDVRLPSQGISPYREFVLGEDPRSYDHIVNLPKLKTHAMMGLSLGVKNILGFVRGLEKARWHLRAGRDRELFAAVLIDLYNVVRPSLTILDGITAMDGEGPTHGRPRSVGIVVMSTNAFNLDREVERLVGLKEPLTTSAVAERAGLLGEYEVFHEGRGSIPRLRFPGPMATDWALPSAVKGLLRSAFVRRPKVRKDLCKACGICAKVCTAGAIATGDKVPSFNYERCIRCYCCQEMCPQGAIRLNMGKGGDSSE